MTRTKKISCVSLAVSVTSSGEMLITLALRMIGRAKVSVVDLIVSQIVGVDILVVVKREVGTSMVMKASIRTIQAGVRLSKMAVIKDQAWQSYRSRSCDRGIMIV